MIFPIIAPLIGLAIIVFILIRLSNQRANTAAAIKAEIEAKKAQILEDDRRSDRMLLEDLGNTDDAASLIQNRLDERSAVFAAGLEHPEEWDSDDLHRFVNRVAADEIQKAKRPLVLKGILWIVGVLIMTVISIVINFKIHDSRHRTPSDDLVEGRSALSSVDQPGFSNEDFISEESINE